METITIQAKSAKLSDEQFFHLCSDNKEIRFERDKDKNIIIMSPTGSKTGIINAEILRELSNWNKKHKLGYCFDSSSGFTLPNGAIFAPDASWIAKERWEKISENDKERFAPVCPDFIIEVRSKSDTLKQQQDKMVEWIANGCKLAWLIDLEHHTTHVYRPKKKMTVHTFKETLTGDKILPGFVLKMSGIVI